MGKNAQRRPFLHWLVSDLPPAGSPHPVLLDIAEGDPTCLGDFSGSPPRAVVFTENRAAARHARRLVGCEVVVGRATAMPFASHCFQSIGCFKHFERVVDKETTCREWRRIVRPEGRLLAVARLTDEAGQERTVTGADWCAYFSNRGFIPERVETDSPSPKDDRIARVLLRVSSQDQQEFSFSGPFQGADVRRLSAYVEERVRLRRAGRLGSTPEAVTAEAGRQGRTLPLAPYLDEADVHAFAVLRDASAPLFAEPVGGRVTRLVKVLLNLPLRLLGRPQSFFNRMVRDVLGVCLRTLREVTGFQRLMRNELTIQRATVDRLVDENERLRERLEEMEVRLSDVIEPPGTPTEASPKGQRQSAQQGKRT